jgi:hypothetical protein
MSMPLQRYLGQFSVSKQSTKRSDGMYHHQQASAAMQQRPEFSPGECLMSLHLGAQFASSEQDSFSSV